MTRDWTWPQLGQLICATTPLIMLALAIVATWSCYPTPQPATTERHLGHPCTTATMPTTRGWVIHTNTFACTNEYPLRTQ